MIDFGSAPEDASNSQSDLNAEAETFIDLKKAQSNIQEQTNQKMSTEISMLDQLFKQLKLTTTGSKERKTIIDQINSTYGTTLKNLSDEEKFVKQVDAAYKTLTNQIKLKAQAEATSQQLTALYKQALDIQLKLGKSGAGGVALGEQFFKGLTKVNVNDLANTTEVESALDVYRSKLSEKQKSVFDSLTKDNQKNIALFQNVSTADVQKATANIFGGKTESQIEASAKLNADKQSKAREQQAKNLEEQRKNAGQLASTLETIDQISQQAASVEQQLSKSKFDVSQVGKVDNKTKNDTLNFFNDLKKQLQDLENEGKRMELEVNIVPKNFNETFTQLKAIQTDQERIIDLETERAKQDARNNGTLTKQNESLIEQIGTQKKLNLARRTGNQISAEGYKEELRIQKLREDIQQQQFEQSQFIQEQAISDLETKKSEIQTKFENARTKKSRDSLKAQLAELTRLQIESEQKSSNERIQQIEQNRKRDIENAKGDAKEIQLFEQLIQL